MLAPEQIAAVRGASNRWIAVAGSELIGMLVLTVVAYVAAPVGDAALWTRQAGTVRAALVVLAAAILGGAELAARAVRARAVAAAQRGAPPERLRRLIAARHRVAVVGVACGGAAGVLGGVVHLLGADPWALVVGWAGFALAVARYGSWLGRVHAWLEDALHAAQAA